jgi:peptide/nickel transport system ATP-binding protein
MRSEANIVEFDHLSASFFTDIGVVRAVDGVSFDVPQGMTVGVWANPAAASRSPAFR